MRLTPRKPRLLLAANPAAKDAVICINGILSSESSWQDDAVAWGNANTSLSWSLFHYDADALLTGLWLDQHAKGLLAAIQAVRDAGARKVHILAHSEGNEVTIRACQLGAYIDDFWGLAAAAYEDCGSGWWRNGLNDLLKSGNIQRVILGVSKNDGVLGAMQVFTPYFWFKTLGLNGPKNTSAVPLVSDFMALPQADLSAMRYTVGRDDAMNHLSWPQTSVYATVAAVEGKP